MKTRLFWMGILPVIFLSIIKCGGSGLCEGECTPFVEMKTSQPFEHVAFVSSVRTSGNLGGISGADTLCQKYASEGEKTKILPGVWRAILSDSNSNSRDRIIFKADTRLSNTIGEVVLSKVESLWSGRLASPIKYDQNGAEIMEKLEVWSGTLANGRSASGPSLVTTCTNWNDGTTIVNGGVIGTVGALDERWIEADDFVGCAKTDEKARLYCINSL